jgi:peptidoglycan/LPS O-acetylase OafA/YrhL
MLQRFRRITSSSSWIPQIDGLRFMAIGGVLLAHSFGEVAHGTLPLPPHMHWFADICLLGGRGVELFFAISGYILCRPFLRQYRLGGHKVSLGRYFLRRVTRLEPPYILSLLIYVVAQLLALHITFRAILPHLLAGSVYLHSQIYPYGSSINFVTWTLEIEIQFYILAPLLANVFRIPNTAMRRAVIIVLIGLAMFVSLYGGQRFQLSVFAYLHFFLVGFLLADLLEFPRHAPRQYWSWDLVSLIVWPAFFLLDPSGRRLFWMVPLIALAYLAAFHGKLSNRFFRNPLVALTGGMCYSIYLMHMLIFETAFRVVRHVHVASRAATIPLQMVLLIIPTIVLSALYFLLIERPCMDPNWPSALWKKLRSASDHAPQL